MALPGTHARLSRCDLSTDVRFRPRSLILAPPEWSLSFRKGAWPRDRPPRRSAADVCDCSSLRVAAVEAASGAGAGSPVPGLLIALREIAPGVSTSRCVAALVSRGDVGRVEVETHGG